MGIYHKNELLNRNVEINSKKINITYLELENLRKQHNNKCDICGKTETANTRPDVKTTPNQLCIDHDHNTQNFRGFLCVQCNRNMGWYDKYKDKILSYVNKK